MGEFIAETRLFGIWHWTKYEGEQWRCRSCFCRPVETLARSGPNSGNEIPPQEVFGRMWNDWCSHHIRLAIVLQSTILLFFIQFFCSTMCWFIFFKFLSNIILLFKRKTFTELIQCYITFTHMTTILKLLQLASSTTKCLKKRQILLRQ